MKKIELEPYTGPKLTEEQKRSADEVIKAFHGAFDETDWAALSAADARRRQEAIDQADWVVETKLSENNRSVEVSAVIKGSHGHTSWGWHDDGETKFVVLRVESLYQKVPVMRSIINLAEEQARRICRIKNK
ncbi:hypothetical protein [Serratia phage vB_SspM_LC53]|nr:hypothetical protein [Serratia phage vB_SspM_LC53]